jgi:processive 1,2-diacylglycerol beta-glucosyltransferase
VQFIQEYEPHITVCTHFMPAGVISHLIREEELDVHLSIVTTDLDFHSMWLSRAFHRYFVALESTKHHLLALGLPEERITVSGIPVSPEFSRPVDREAVLAKYSLRGDQPLLLVSAGAIGGGPVKLIAQRLLKVHHPCQAIFICGKNEKLRAEMEEFAEQHGPQFRTLGFTDDMANLMKVATLFIGKPGGLTVAETTAVGLPMVIDEPIPGQEERNSDQLLEAGCAIKINDVTVLDYKLNKLLGDPGRLARMREACLKMGRPHAAETIVETLLTDTLPPLHISKEEQKRMAKALREGVEE